MASAPTWKSCCCDASDAQGELRSSEIIALLLLLLQLAADGCCYSVIKLISATATAAVRTSVGRCNNKGSSQVNETALQKSYYAVVLQGGAAEEAVGVGRNHYQRMRRL